MKRPSILLALLAVPAALGATLLVRNAPSDAPALHEARPLPASPRPSEVAKPLATPAKADAARPAPSATPSAGAPDAKPLDAKLTAAPDAGASIGHRYTIEPPFAIVDGRTFATEKGSPTRLDGLEGPAAEAVCLDEAARLWACGLQARAALNNLIRKQTVLCTTVTPAEAGVLVSTCRVESGDLAGELVRAGFARPVAANGTALGPAEAEARRDGRGLWRGGWTVRP